MENDEKYLDIRDKLRRLEPVKASDDFVHKLHLKIVEMEAEKRHEHAERFDKEKGGFLRNLFANRQYPWLIPAAGFTVVLFFVFYITYLNKNILDQSPNTASTEQKTTTENNTSSDGISNNTAPSVTDTTSLKKVEEGKDIAGEYRINKEKGNVPPPVSSVPETYTDRSARRDRPIDTKTEAPKTVVTKETEKEYFSNEKKATEEIKDNDKTDDALKNKIQTEELDESSVRSGITAPADTVNGKNSLSKKVKEGRLKEKIDSLSRIDLEKIREEIQR